MPDPEKIVAALSASEGWRRSLATRRLNRSLARHVGDPWRTKYNWQLVPVLEGMAPSWRDFHRAQLGFPWPQRQWAITTLTCGEHKLLVGGVILLSTAQRSVVRWARWHEFPQVLSEDALYNGPEPGEEPFVPFYDKHDFRRYLLTLD